MISKRKKVLLFTTGVIAFIFSTILFILLLNIQTFKPKIEAAASKILEMDVRINGNLGISLVPYFGISLKDLRIQKDGVDFGSIEMMRIGPKLLPLIWKKVHISRISLIKPIFFIVRDKNGVFNFAKSGHKESKTPLQMKKTSISQGRILYTDKTLSKTFQFDDLNLTIRNLIYNRLKDISFRGKLKCKTLKVNKFSLTNIDMSAKAKEGILKINPFSMNIFDGIGKGKLHFNMRGALPYFQAIVTLKQFRIEKLMKVSSKDSIPQKSIEGLVDFSADLTASGESLEEIKQSLSGDFSLSGENLILYSIDIDALIPKYENTQNFNLVDIGAFFIAGPYGPVLTKGFNFTRLYEESQGGKGIIKKLVSVWKVKKGIAEATDVAIASKKYRIAMKGGLNLSSNCFNDVIVAVVDKQGKAVYSQKLYGSFLKPQIEKVSILKSITGSVSNLLTDAWNLIRDENHIFYKGAVADPLE
jgi:AsmA protein